MDEQQEYMNERAFSSSLAQEVAADPGVDAYAINQDPMAESIIDRNIPDPDVLVPPSSSIPIPPPLPANAALY